MNLDILIAYIGPGLGAGAVAAVLGVIGSIILGIFAVLWYPIKRIIKKSKAAKSGSTTSTSASSTPAAAPEASTEPAAPKE